MKATLAAVADKAPRFLWLSQYFISCPHSPGLCGDSGTQEASILCAGALCTQLAGEIGSMEECKAGFQAQAWRWHPSLHSHATDWYLIM